MLIYGNYYKCFKDGKLLGVFEWTKERYEHCDAFTRQAINDTGELVTQVINDSEIDFYENN